MDLIDKYLGEALGGSYKPVAMYKKSDKVKFISKDDEFYGKEGVVYNVGKGKTKGNYTIKIGGKVVSRDNSELSKA